LVKTLLKGGTLVTLNARGEILEGADLLIEDDRIAGISPGENLAGTDRLLDCKRKIIIPGLVSAHSHLTGLFQRGLWDETSFESWSLKSSATERVFNPSAEDIYLIHSAACVEFIRHGVTTVLNMFSLPAKYPLEHVQAACRALADAGIRGILAPTLRDQSPDDTALVAGISTVQSWLSLAREIAGCVGDFKPRVSLMLAPSAPQRCTDRLLITCRELSDELGVGLHTHLAETRRHAEIGKRLYGEPMVNHLEKIGFLTPRLSAAHAIWLEGQEIDILRKHDVKIVHNPSSNMKLGSGAAQVKQMLRRGISVGLGADSVNAGTVYSVFEQMKLAVLLSRACWREQDWVLPSEALEMGVRGGAKAVLLDESIGSLEEGKKADLVILDPAVSLLPLNRLVEQLALCENGGSVDSLFVDGRPVMLERKIMTVDEQAIITRLSALRPRIAGAAATTAGNS